MEKVLLQIALILIFTKIGGLISRKLKMPDVLGALVAGVILGPVVLNLVQYDSNIKLLANIGVIMLMFLAGLETNFEEMKKAGLTSFVIALCGVIVPLILGTISAYLFFTNFWENLFVGVILTATSVSISVETLTELGQLNTRAGINILGAAVIDDVLGLILISVILAMAQASGTSGSSSDITVTLLLTFLKILIFCVGSVLLVAFLPKIVNHFTEGHKPSKRVFVFSAAAALLAAFGAEALGIAAITGSYICGLALSRVVHREYIERHVKVVSTSFLSLIFFASVGIEANLKGINWEAGLITLVMFLVAVIGKIVGCGGAASFFGMSRSESLQIGVGMISRGEVAIITANIGLQDGIISEEVFLPTLIVVILTTIVTPALLKVAFSHKNEKLLDRKM